MIYNSRRVLFILIILVTILLLILAACGGKAASIGDVDLAMAPMADMPSEMKSAPTTVQQAYQFAVANPEVMKQIPCYCGCGKIGHTSNYDCYVSGVESDGKINYDTHALGCSICVDITQDTMRLLRQGKTVTEIKSIVDQTYSKYGLSNIP